MPMAKTILKSFKSVPNLQVHLLISPNSKKVMEIEGASQAEDFICLADSVHDIENFGAPPASGSWLHDGMVICPCSMASLAAIATGAGYNLIHRSADVCLKERRPLILVTRESPLNLVHLRNMTAITEAGGLIMPFSPAFYTRDNSMTGAFKQFAGRILDQLHINHRLCERWQGCI